MIDPAILALAAGPACGGAPAAPLVHPLAEEARAEGLGGAHLTVVDDGTPLPVLLSRAEFRLPAQELGPNMSLRIGARVDARSLPGRRHALRGILTLVVDTERMRILEAALGALEWRTEAEPWKRVPAQRDRPAPERYDGRVAAIAARLSAWALTRTAEPAIAAALLAGAAMQERSALGFDSDAALHEAAASAPGAGGVHRARGLAWAAQQRGNAARQRRHADLMTRLAAQLAQRPDRQREAALLAAAATAARRHDAGRAAAVRRAAAALEKRERVARERQRQRDALARLQASAPALRDALVSLLQALPGAGEALVGTQAAFGGDDPAGKERHGAAIARARAALHSAEGGC